MDPKRWQEMERVFEQVVEREPGERASLLERLCSGDEELRRAVEALIAADVPADAFLESLAPESVPGSDSHTLPRRVGAYRLIRKIGEGGMSVVYLAVRDDGTYQMRVAIKFFQADRHRQELLRRFQTERQILASLDHPHIGKLLDGGTTESGVPYFVMEYVEGLPMDEYCDRNGLSIRERLELFREVCDAVQYAHSNLVVHRDIKPSNLLVRAAGQVKLLDFGIAKLLNPEFAGVADPTRVDLSVMTPEYASPEQARGEPMTTATDVYSLGVLLYRLLTGSPPYEVKNRALPEVLQAICEEIPRRPSALVRAMADGSGEAASTAPGGMSVLKLSRALTGDLDNIVLKALRKEPKRRYSTAEQLSEDIRCYLAGLPVRARDDSFGYRLRKFVGRHRAAVAVLTVGALLVTAFAVVAGVQSVRLARALSRAEREAAKAQAVTGFVEEMLGSASPLGGVRHDVTVVEVLDRASKKLDESFRGKPETEAKVRATLGRTYRDLEKYAEARPFLERTLELRRDLFGNQHAEVAESLSDLGILELRQGNLERANALYREAISIQEQVFGEDGLELSRTLNRLGALLRLQAKYPEAESVVRQALAIQRRRLADPHVEIGRTLTLMAAVLQDKGDLKSAEAAYREALANLRQTAGESPELANVLNAFATLLDETGDTKSALPLLHEALAIRRGLFGNDNTAVGHTLTVLAWVSMQKGDLLEAERAQEEAMSIFRKVVGEESREVATGWGVLGAISLKSDDLVGAQQKFERSLSIRRKIRASPKLIASDLHWLGQTFLRQRRFDEAEKHLRESVESYRSVFGENNSATGDALATLADVLRQKGDLNGSLPLFRQAIETLAKTLPPDDPSLATWRSSFGALLTDLGRFEEAREELVPAFAVLEKKHGRSHAETKLASERLMALCRRSGDRRLLAEVRAVVEKR